MTSRRDFLRAAAAAASSRAAYGQAANRKLKLGLIGAGWYGMVDMQAAWKTGNVECVAVADVDTDHLAQSAAECEKAQGTRPAVHKDYRELLNAPGLDAIIIATPPHWHALQFIDACKKGLPVYLEKPISYDVREGRAMVDAWKKAGNVVQVGFQRRQPNGYGAARDFIRSGAAGRIVQVDAQIHYRAGTPDTKQQDPPSSLDWDAWCGPAPKLPYSPAIAHKSWRLEKAYGNGHLVDWGIHVIDAVRVILEESTPKKIHAVGGLYELAGRITTPDTLTVQFEFERCPVIWRHRIWGAAEYPSDTANGVFFYGDKATVFATDGRWMVLPRGKGDKQEFQTPEARDAGPRHMSEFLDAVRTGKQPGCTIDDAFRSTATVQLAMAAYDSGAPLGWDASRETIVNNPAALKQLEREYRAPYRHPFSGYAR
jgi:predicted dehydrogenase